MSKFIPNKNVYKDMFNFEKNYWWYVALRENLNFFIKKFKPKTVLDAGCGTGANMIEIKNYVDKIYGIDISKEAIEICNENKLNNLFLGNLVNLPFEDNMFDLIYCMDVFGNLNDIESDTVLREFYRCLNNSGYLIIQTAAIGGLTSSHDEYWDIQKRYQLEELGDKISKNKYVIIKKSYRHFLLFPMIALIKILNKNKKELNSGDFFQLPFFINYSLIWIMRIENFLLRFLNFPIGSSAFIIARKN